MKNIYEKTRKRHIYIWNVKNKMNYIFMRKFLFKCLDSLSVLEKD